jgi:hypothetical protein
MKMNMKMPKLSQQAMIVAFAAVLPVLASAYKLRILDAVVLLLSGALAVYNVNCLTSGSCNTWATVVSISFFIMTILQLMAPREGLEGEEEMPKEADVIVTDKEEVTVMSTDEPAPMEDKMPAESKPEKAMAKPAPLLTDEEFELLKAQLTEG